MVTEQTAPSQHPSAVVLLNSIGDALQSFKVKGIPYPQGIIKTTIELPKESYQKFKNEIEERWNRIDINDITYGVFKFSIKEL